MATQGTEKVFGGTPYKRYPDPASPGTANAQGLYPWSVFKAPICEFTAPDILIPLSGLSAVSYVDLLLFTSDIPAILELRATNTNTNLQFSAGAANTLGVNFLTTAPGGGTFATISAQGKVLSGYTAGAGIFCTGFPARGTVVSPGGGEDAQAYTEVFCIANSPVIASPVSSLSLAYNQSTANGFSPVPVIIGFLEYTAAIRDAGNLITRSDGSLYQVVGLWNQP
jgi:hypothetical protein